MAWFGLATVADGSTEPFEALCCSLLRVVLVRHGQVEWGWVGCGNSCRRQHRRLRLPLLLSLEGGCGAARHSLVWHGVVRKGVVGRQLQTAARRALALPAALKAVTVRQYLERHGQARLSAAWSGNSCRRQHWGDCSPLSPSRRLWWGMVRSGKLGQGPVGFYYKL